MVEELVRWLRSRLDGRGDDGGFSTAELLANAAMAIGAVAAIWFALELMGVRVIEMIGEQLMGGG